MNRIWNAIVFSVAIAGFISISSPCLAKNQAARDAITAVTVLQDLGGSAATVGLALDISEGHRPANGWLVTGYLTGIMAMFKGIGLWHGAAEGDCTCTYEWIAGLPGIVLGISNIVMTSYGLSLPVSPERPDEEEQGAQLSFAPLVAPDGQGGYYSGIGINLVGW